MPPTIEPSIQTHRHATATAGAPSSPTSCARAARACSPRTSGCPNGGRRRTPGLRREEVAQLAGVGTTWYTWLEQGRDVRASLDVLEALARALRLTPAERGHLILLGRGEQAPACPPPAERVSATLRRLVENLGPSPAFILGRRWDYLAWNRAAGVVFGWDPELDPRPSRNHIWLTFMDPARRELMPDWERSARRLVAKFRADSARHIGDPGVRAADRLAAASSPEFARWWERHEVAQRRRGPQGAPPPGRRPLVFEHAVFRARGLRPAAGPLLAACRGGHAGEARAAARGPELPALALAR